MTATTENRKRSREEDGFDSMPLSKRINNLHINNFAINYTAEFVDGGHLGNSSLHHNHLPIQQPNINNNHTDYECLIPTANRPNEQQHPEYYRHEQSNEVCGPSSQNYNGTIENYNPELTQQENPYYYNKNKLLYELHAERVRRINQ